jgi:protease II
MFACYRVLCKDLQSDQAGFLVFMEKDINCCVDITSTKDFKYVTINSNTRTSSEVYVMESGHVRGGLWPVQKRSDKVQYFLEHHNGFFYILTNAPLEGTETANGGYYLARCRAEKSEMDKWQVYLSLCLCLALHACVYVFVGKEWGGGGITCPHCKSDEESQI